MSSDCSYINRLGAVFIQARPLSKRIERAKSPCSSSFHAPSDLRPEFAAWESLFKRGCSTFATRLSLDDLTHESASRAFRCVEPLDCEELEDATWLAQLLECHEAERYPDSTSAIAFFQLLQPFAEKALDSIDHSFWAPDVRRQLVDSIARKLSGFAAPTLMAEFSDFRKCTNPRSSDEYWRFVQHLSAGGWLDLFHKYPVLARILVSESRKWTRHLTEVELRIHQDHDSICNGFSIPLSKLLPIANVRASGDMHDGRCVLVLTSAAGTSFLYKPRTMDLEGKFNALLEAMSLDYDAQNPSPIRHVKLESCQVIPGDGYGYQAFIARRDCQSMGSAAHAFYQYGGLLGLLHMVGATDGHFENIIVAGEVPHFIDAETLLQSESVPFSFHHAAGQIPITFAGDEWLPSVQRVGILPSIHLVPDSADESGAVDVSAMGYVASGRVKVRVLAAVNTDAMCWATTIEEREEGTNSVRVAGHALAPSAFIAEVIAGYTEVVKRVTRHIEEGALQQFAHCRSRTIFRSTHLYAKAIWRSTQPDCLTSGVRHSLVFEPLAIPFCMDGGATKRWAIFKDEVAQLEQLDIPRFERDTSTKSLYCPRSGVEVCDFFSDTGVESAEVRAKSLEVSLTSNCTIIREALAATTANANVREEQRVTVAMDSQDSKARDAYMEIVAYIVETAVCSPGGLVNWICAQRVPHSNRKSYKPLGDSFYDGRLGVVCFLAAANTQIRNPRVQSVIDGALREVTQIFGNPSWRRAAIDTLSGGFTGAGGLLYAFLCISNIFKDSEYIELAANVAWDIDRSQVYRNWGVDFFDGAAGLAFALARLQQTSPDSRFELALNNCSSYLLELLQPKSDQDPDVQGFAGWVPSGLAHGTAGVGLALLEAFGSTNDQRLHAMGIKLFATAFTQAVDENDVMVNSLCRGTAGLAVAHRLVSRMVNLPELQNRSNAIRHKESVEMTVCCGRAGQWLTSSRNVGPRENVSLAPLTFSIRGAEDISLFRGLSGIGWALLERCSETDVPGLFEFGIQRISA